MGDIFLHVLYQIFVNIIHYTVITETNISFWAAFMFSSCKLNRFFSKDSEVFFVSRIATLSAAEPVSSSWRIFNLSSRFCFRSLATSRCCFLSCFVQNFPNFSSDVVSSSVVFAARSAATWRARSCNRRCLRSGRRVTYLRKKCYQIIQLKMNFIFLF